MLTTKQITIHSQVKISRKDGHTIVLVTAAGIIKGTFDDSLFDAIVQPVTEHFSDEVKLEKPSTLNFIPLKNVVIQSTSTQTITKISSLIVYHDQVIASTLE